MTRSQRRTDLWLTAFAIALPVASLVENALSTELPQILPTPIHAHALLWFVIFLVLIVVTNSVLFLVRRMLAKDPIHARNRPLRRWNLVLTLLVGVQGAAAGILSNLVIASIPWFAQLSQPYRTLLTVVLPIALIALFIAWPLLADVISTRSKKRIDNREAFLLKLADRYSKYLDGSLQDAVRVQLNLKETPAALQRSEITVTSLTERAGASHSGSAFMTIEPNKTLRPIYEAAARQLLILGNEGAGKSTQLHRLGRELVSQALSDHSVRIPVILDISTWASNHQDSLEKWLVNEIGEIYQVPKSIANQWVQSRQIIPLLDALDVMPDPDQPRCVDSINEFLATNHNEPLVVCSRFNALEQVYKIYGKRLDLQQAVTFQALSDEVILQALKSSGPQVDALRQVVATDADLRDAIRSPLLLSLVMLTYKDLLAKDIPLPKAGDGTAWQRELFARYVDRMIDHQPGTEKHPQRYETYERDEYKRALRWLGYELKKHSEITFYLERLQIDWLPDTSAMRFYRTLLWIIRTCLALGVGLLGGLGIGAAVALGGWLIVGVTSGIIVGAGSGLVGMVGGLGVWDYFNIEKDIEPVARLYFPWNKIARSIVSGLLLGSPVGIAGCLMVGLRFELAGGVAAGLIGGLGIAVGVGVSNNLGGGPGPMHIPEEDLLTANEGIARSKRFSLLIMVILAVDFAVTTGLVIGLVGELRFGRGSGLGIGLLGGLAGLLAGLAVGVAFGLRVGGVAALKHAALRLALRRSGVVPPDLVYFLHEADEHVLLRRAGGGYQFIHQTFRDDFARQYIPSEEV